MGFYHCIINFQKISETLKYFTKTLSKNEHITHKYNLKKPSNCTYNIQRQHEIMLITVMQSNFIEFLIKSLILRGKLSIEMKNVGNFWTTFEKILLLKFRYDNVKPLKILVTFINFHINIKVIKQYRRIKSQTDGIT